MTYRLKLKTVGSAKAQQHPFHIVDPTPLPLFMAVANVFRLLHNAFLELTLSLLNLVLMFCSRQKLLDWVMTQWERLKFYFALTLNAAMMQPGGKGNGNTPPTSHGSAFDQGVNVAAKAVGQTPHDLKRFLGGAAAVFIIYGALRIGVYIARGVYDIITYDSTMEDQNQPGMPQEILDQEESDAAAKKYREDKEKRYNDPLRGPGAKYRDEHWKDDSDDDIGDLSDDD